MSVNESHAGGKFRKGVSGNPAGRPKGSRNQATLLMESLLAEKAEQLIRKALEIALDGDFTAVRFCLERLIARRQDRPIQITLPPVEDLQQMAVAMAKISSAIAEGEITPAEGASLSQILKTQAEIIIAAGFERRIAELEQCARRSNGSQQSDGQVGKAVVVG